MKTIKQTKTFEVGQIAYCNGGCTMQLPTFYKVVKRTDKTVWLQEIANQLIEHDGYGQGVAKFLLIFQKVLFLISVLKIGKMQNMMVAKIKNLLT